jgi:hypothetical protein
VALFGRRAHCFARCSCLIVPRPGHHRTHDDLLDPGMSNQPDRGYSARTA